MTTGRKYHIGIVGTGFIARGLMNALKHRPQLHLSKVLTRRPIASITKVPVPKKLITHDINKLIRQSDLIVECTGDAIHGTEMAEAVLKAGIPVVTMNPELQITTGTMLAKMGTFIEAEGDQPGTLAALDIEMKNMGFKPIVYGNIKRYLNLNPTPEDMKYWSKNQGISYAQVTAFTDGSKVQIEQALVANGLGATIACRGLSGISCKNHEDGAHRLGEIANSNGKPISDYVLCSTAPAGVFVVATHDKEQIPYLKYLKLGPGPDYIIVKPYHLCHLEITKTILKVLNGDPSYSFNNGPQPTIQVAATTKRNINVGKTIKRGLGSFEIRGEAVKISDEPNAVPITLIHQAEFVKPVEKGQLITFDDVRLPKTRALELWQQILEEAVGTSLTAETYEQEVKQPHLVNKRPLFLKQLFSLRMLTNITRSSS